MKKKGFTLAELLVVVGIIAVLVAIAIPVFTAQLEKAREATDISNIRAAYAELMAAAVSGGADSGDTIEVVLTQKTDGWDSLVITWPDNFTQSGSPVAEGVATIGYATNTGGAITGCTVSYAAGE